MSTKDYKVIAETIRNAGEACEWQEDSFAALNILAIRLSRRFSQDNPKFNTSKFFEDCNIAY